MQWCGYEQIRIKYNKFKADKSQASKAQEMVGSAYDNDIFLRGCVHG